MAGQGLIPRPCGAVAGCALVGSMCRKRILVNNGLLVFAALLAAAAPTITAQVKAAEENVTMPTWEIGPSQVHSVFYDARDRGGEKNIYPYTLNEILTNRRVDKTYRAVILENEYIKIMVLPEIGGRLHGALDKTNGYVWLYWQ
jgi:hypothetical protein